MNFQLDNIIQILLSPDNQRRTEAEQFIHEITTNNFEEAVDGFLHVMNNQDPNVSQSRVSCPAWVPSSSRRSTWMSRTTWPNCPRTSSNS